MWAWEVSEEPLSRTVHFIMGSLYLCPRWLLIWSFCPMPAAAWWLVSSPKFMFWHLISVSMVIELGPFTVARGPCLSLPLCMHMERYSLGVGKWVLSRLSIYLNFNIGISSIWNHEKELFLEAIYFMVFLLPSPGYAGDSISVVSNGCAHTSNSWKCFVGNKDVKNHHRTRKPPRWSLVHGSKGQGEDEGRTKPSTGENPLTQAVNPACRLGHSCSENLN